jgi:hypothetical protein
MPKRVPANLANAGTHRCRFDVPSQNALLPAWLPLAVRKYPVARFSKVVGAWELSLATGAAIDREGSALKRGSICAVGSALAGRVDEGIGS